MAIELVTYQRVAGHSGAEFKCQPHENGKGFLVFSGSTSEIAESAAKEWVNREFDTPERRQRLADANARRLSARKANESSHG